MRSRVLEARLLKAIAEERVPRLEREEELSVTLEKCISELGDKIYEIKGQLGERCANVEERLATTREEALDMQSALAEPVQVCAEDASLALLATRDELHSESIAVGTAAKSGLLELSAEAKRERLALRDTLATQAEDVLAMQGALEEKLASEIYAMRQVLEAESGANTAALQGYADKLESVSGEMKETSAIAQAQGAKQLELATREEMKVQLMLMKEDIEQLMGAIPTLQDGQVEDASKFAKLEVGVEKLRDELAGVTTGLTLLESMVAAQ